MSNLKNDLLLRALRGEQVERLPVWMMRQAGRYLPDYLKLKAKYDFFTRVQTPELATEITLQPIDQVGVDAAKPTVYGFATFIVQFKHAVIAMHGGDKRI